VWWRVEHAEYEMACTFKTSLSDMDNGSCEMTKYFVAVRMCILLARCGMV
jgi:hypothetical protein